MKDYTRDYATAAFRFYAKNGKSADKYKQQIYNEALETIQKRESYIKSSIGKPTEAALISAEKAVNDKMAEIKDMEAVELTLAELEAGFSGYGGIGNIRAYDKKSIIQAIEIVYFKDADKELEKGDIHNRVHEAEIYIPASESSIYRWLKQARQLFSQKRGLRLKN